MIINSYLVVNTLKCPIIFIRKDKMVIRVHVHLKCKYILRTEQKFELGES